MIKHNGAIVHEGKSLYDGQPIVAIATGFTTGNTNRKIGSNVVQVWVLKRDKKPTDALKDGSSKSVCASCPLQHKVCYVNPMPLATIYKKYQGGFDEDYPQLNAEHLELMEVRKKVLRLTAYGEATVFPYYVFAPLIDYAVHTVGYTHQWRTRMGKPWLGKLQASVHSAEEAQQAQAMGWKTYRIILEDEELLPGEILCPNYKNPAIQCETCGLCDGKTANIADPVHGQDWHINNFNKLKEVKNG